MRYYLSVFLSILGLLVNGQTDANERINYMLVLPSEESFTNQVYFSYKQAYEKFCDQSFIDQQTFRDKFLTIVYMGADNVELGRGSDAYRKLIRQIGDKVVFKISNLDYEVELEPSNLNDQIKLSTKITSEATDSKGNPFLPTSLMAKGCEGRVIWYLEIYQEDWLVAKGEIMFATVRKSYFDPLVALDHKTLLSQLKKSLKQ
jgi:hypothetical protein